MILVLEEGFLILIKRLVGEIFGKVWCDYRWFMEKGVRIFVNNWLGRFFLFLLG